MDFFTAMFFLVTLFITTYLPPFFTPSLQKSPTPHRFLLLDRDNVAHLPAVEIYVGTTKVGHVLRYQQPFQIKISYFAGATCGVQSGMRITTLGVFEESAVSSRI